MTHTMPPAQLKILLHHYTMNEPYPIKGDSDAVQAHVQVLFALGLLHADPPDCPYGHWTTTSRGNAYVEMLLNTPLPEQRWVDPRTESK